MESIKNLRNRYKAQGVFYTPFALAEKLHKMVVDYLGKEPDNVYDPTCGAGNLLSVFPNETLKYGQDVDAVTVSNINMCNFDGYSGDSLEDDGFKGVNFQAIVANPPFSIAWDAKSHENDEKFILRGGVAPPSRADWAFNQHIISHLAEDGVAVVLCFPGILYRGQRESKIRRVFCEQGWIKRVMFVPGNTFEDTTVATVILIMSLKHGDRSITFEVEGKSRVAKFEEIESEDFDLSPTRYITTEPERKEININAVNRAVANELITYVQSEVAKLMMLERTFGDEMYLDEIADALNVQTKKIKERKKWNL